MTSLNIAQRPIVGHPIPVEIDLLKLGMIEISDLEMIRETAASFGRIVTLDGTPPTSTLETTQDPLHYSVTNGSIISRQLPRIARLYETLIRN